MGSHTDSGFTQDGSQEENTNCNMAAGDETACPVKSEDHVYHYIREIQHIFMHNMHRRNLLTGTHERKGNLPEEG